MLLLFLIDSNDSGILAPHPKWTELNDDDDVGVEKCLSSDIVLVPAAVAFGSGQLDGDKNRIDPLFGAASPSSLTLTVALLIELVVC